MINAMTVLNAVVLTMVRCLICLMCKGKYISPSIFMFIGKALITDFSSLKRCRLRWKITYINHNFMQFDSADEICHLLQKIDDSLTF